MINESFEEIKFKINSLEELTKIKNLSKKDGKTKIKFQISDNDYNYVFSLNDKEAECGVINNLDLNLLLFIKLNI